MMMTNKSPLIHRNINFWRSINTNYDNSYVPKEDMVYGSKDDLYLREDIFSSESGANNSTEATEAPDSQANEILENKLNVSNDHSLIKGTWYIFYL